MRRFDCQLGIGQDPDMNVQRLEVGVLGDASDLEGSVGLGDGANSDLVRVDALWDWCEPSVGEVDLGRVLCCSVAGVFPGSPDAPLGVEKIEESDSRFYSAQDLHPVPCPRGRLGRCVVHLLPVRVEVDEGRIDPEGCVVAVQVYDVGA